MQTTQVEQKRKSLFDHLKAVNDVIDSVGTVLKTGALVVAAVVSLLSYLDKTNRLNVVGEHEIEIANVYNQTETAAIPRLKDQGFIPAIVRVCSGSVGAGRVRQVVQMSNGREVALVNEHGVTQAGRGLQSSTAITVKVATGQRCPKS